jgi:ATP/ADP translocase
MKRFFRSIIDIRKGEITLTLLMFFYYYLLLVTYYFLKPARDSLFLVKLGANQLPLVFILIAVIVVPVTTLYSRASRSLKLNQLINATALLLIVNLVILRWLLTFQQPWVFYLFYIWVSIYGALSTSQFWLFANAVFDATQAKRVFVLFGLGGIIGAFSGGEVTSLVITYFDVSTENLLFFCMVFLAVCMVLVNAVWTLKRRSDQDTPTAHPPRSASGQKESYAEIFKSITQSRHLMLIVGIIAMTMATGTFVDYQFKTVSVDAFPTKQELTSFLGQFYGRLSLLAFVFQLLFSYRVLRILGVGGVIMFLPLGLLGGTLAMLIYPGLLAGILVKGSDNVFRYSIDKTGRELLFLPVPLEVKKRTKIFIDMFVDRWFRGFAGLALLLFVNVLAFGVRELSIVVLVLLAVWLAMTFLVRKEYVNAFREALERREIDPAELRINIAEASTLRTLEAALESDNERQIAYALDLLGDVVDPKIVDTIRPLLKHPSNVIRHGAARILGNQDGDFSGDMRTLLSDASPMVQRDAINYLCRHAGSEKLDVLASFLGDSDARIRAAAVGCASGDASLGARELITDDIIERLLETPGEAGTFVKCQVADALGALASPRFRGHLFKLMDDPSPEVAARAIRAAGATGDREFVSHIIESVSDKRNRNAARDALVSYGERVIGTLGDYIVDRTVPVPTRARLCRVLSLIPSQFSVDALAAILPVVETEIKYYVIKALNALHSRSANLDLNHTSINDTLIDETRTYYTILQVLHIDGFPATPAGALLIRALEEKTDQNLERIFRLLGLRFPARDIHSAYLGIVSTRKDVRASAVEFLDNILKKDLKKYLFPIMDNIPTDAKVQKGIDLFGVSFTTADESLEYLIKGPDPWLASCAIFCATKESPDNVRKLIEKLTQDHHPVVKETALLTMERLSRG